jgi:asparagine synthase (glutamine-hydrolysing)
VRRERQIPMSGLLIAFRGGLSAPWERMMADLDVLGGEASASWFDRDKEIALGRGYRQEHGSAPEAPVVHHRDCAVVLDGRLSFRGTTCPTSEPSSDSFTVIESYLRWGDDCSAHLEGEFAFALWDRRNSRLLCACDVMGRRTLAFRWDGAMFLACTRAVTLLRHPQVPRSVDSVYVADTLCGVWASVPGATVFSAIRRLRPGFCVTIEGPKLVERQADRLRLEHPAQHGTARAASDEFWALLDASTRDRLRGEHRPCILLSGGLDSACVASAVSHEGGAADAFSVLRDMGSSVDERHAIESVLRRYPLLRWHTVEPTAHPPFMESSADAPLCDDPSINGGPFLLSRLRVYRAMAAAGHRTFVDGEGGDDLFDLAMRPGDFVAARAWMPAVRYLAQHRAPRSALWRNLVVPHMRGGLLQAWIARERLRTDPIPPWLTQTFRRRPETRRALAQHADWLARATFAARLPAMLENTPLVALTGAARLLANSVGVSGSSPLIDRSIVEFAARVPVGLRLHPAHRKVLLRRAAAGRLPDEVRWRPKREALYEALLSEELASEYALSLLDTAKGIAPLAEYVDLVQVAGLLTQVRQKGNLDVLVQHKVRSFLAFVSWWQRVELCYGGLDMV